MEYCRCGRPTPDLKLIETWGPPTAGAFPEEGTKGSQLKENSSVFPKGLFSQYKKNHDLLPAVQNPSRISFKNAFGFEL